MSDLEAALLRLRLAAFRRAIQVHGLLATGLDLEATLLTQDDHAAWQTVKGHDRQVRLQQRPLLQRIWKSWFSLGVRALCPLVGKRPADLAIQSSSARTWGSVQNLSHNSSGDGSAG